MEIRYVFATGVLLLGSALAQTAPAAKPQPTSAPKKAQTTTTQKGATTPKSAAAAPLVTPKDKLSYALGMNVGTGLHAQSIDVDPNVFLRGMKDVLGGGKTELTEDEARAMIVQLQQTIRAKAEAEMKVAAEKAKGEAEKNRKEGEAFLAANKTKEGVKTLPSGLQYKIVTEGKGDKPTAADQVSCNYRGTLIDGTEFDSSVKAGKPVSFAVNRVIKGWTEALQLMPVGSKWQLFIPPDLAYGDRAAGPIIKPGSTLVFDVELVSIGPKPAPEPKPAETPKATDTPKPSDKKEEKP
jgi:FKBP-type peptidyl-prolyl cis-trans isomerase